MILTALMFVVALCLSAVAAFYSIVGLTAIFAAAVIPITIMGSILEVAKLTVTVWLHEYWKNAKLLMKVYLSVAVVVLMMITSMGIFGFLSKAHSDQGMVSGDVLAKIAIYDEKIKISKENIDANRKALKQLDDAVDQVMGRSTTEQGADKAVALRRGQSKERARLLADIEAEQKKISSLNEERAPIAVEVRKVEAEVGPIKYIAALVYGDNPDANLLERAVRWIIILLVIVFDPLAVMMLLAATESRKWEKELKQEREFEEALETKRQVAQALDSGGDLPKEDTTIQTVDNHDLHPPGWMFPSPEQPPQQEKSILEQHPYLTAGFKHFEDLKPMVHVPDPVDAPEPDSDEEEQSENNTLRQAKQLWKTDNPGQTLKEQRRRFELGLIDRLPWEDMLDDPRIVQNVGFGKELPQQAQRGEMFVLSGLPSRLYKFNGDKWIEVDKESSSSYTYNESYINYLIEKIQSGEYDPSLLTDNEREQIESLLQRNV